MIADGVTPKNVDQGYILRRLIRRAIREAYKMGYEKPFTADIASIYIEQFSGIYTSVRDNAEKIKTELSIEEGKFSKTLKDGIREFEKLARSMAQQIQPTIDSLKQIQKGIDEKMRPAIDLARKSQQQIQESIKPFIKTIDEFHKKNVSIGVALEIQKEMINKVIT